MLGPKFWCPVQYTFPPLGVLHVNGTLTFLALRVKILEFSSKRSIYCIRCPSLKMEDQTLRAPHQEDDTRAPRRVSQTQRALHYSRAHQLLSNVIALIRWISLSRLSNSGPAEEHISLRTIPLTNLTSSISLWRKSNRRGLPTWWTSWRWILSLD